MSEAELDARVLPRSGKHKTIVATFAEPAAGESVALLNDHEPEPLRLEFERQRPGSYGREHVGPDGLRCLMIRRKLQFLNPLAAG